MILKIEDLTISYNGNRVINKFSLDVKRGSILGIVGPNGAGKTTLLKAILNIITRISGKVTFCSQSINNLQTHEIIKHGISITTQHIQTFNGMSVIENVLLGTPESKADTFLNAFFRTKGTKKIEEKRKKIAGNLLKIVGLELQKNHIAGTLSFGQKKRLDIARALAVGPELLLMDEPTSGLDIGGIEEILEILRKIRDQGNTIVLVEHNMDAVREVCDEIVVINLGKNIALGRPDEVLKNPLVIEAYLGEKNEQLV